MKEPSGNGYVPIIAQAIEEMKAEWGDTFSLEQINLAELERRTGISRGKLRRLKKKAFRIAVETVIPENTRSPNLPAIAGSLTRC